MALAKPASPKGWPRTLMREFRCVRGIVMKWYRITHPTDNLDPFWAEARHKCKILLIPFDCEEKSDEVATSCRAHLIKSTRWSEGQGVSQVRTNFVI